MRCILLNPGPVSLSDAVRKAAVGSDLCHREPEYFKLQDQVRKGLLDVYGCDEATWASVLLGGSGTTALEAMLSSLLPREARLLVIENGVYGERISRIAEIHGVRHEAVQHGWMDAIDFERVERALAEGGFTHLAAVHHETTSGRLNDVHKLAALCETHGVSLLLDTVSSFGAEDIPFDSPALAACAVTANKCLHGIPGLCFVVARRSALAAGAEPPRTLYLHLPLWLEKQDQQGTPFTPPVNSLLALARALDELDKQGGWPGRRAYYADLAGQVRATLAEFGVQAMLEEGASSCVLNAYRIPEGFSYERIHDGLKQWGFVIYAGQGSTVTEMFRISTMGEITHYDIERLLAAIETVFKR
ncbi:MAG: 2-aminoethylphosphonate aminotransferase [Xanthomonadales bacterium]|nr:2-aminoethylphosphonate aminotransferase [Xanthomonadales bacterium]